jgi:hypothetical protein
MKIVLITGILLLSAISCTFMETKVNLYFNISAILNVHGNVTTHIVLPSVTQYVNLPDAILHVLNLKMLFAMLNVRNQNAKLNALIKVVNY